MKPPDLAHRRVQLAIVALLFLLSATAPATAQTTGTIEGAVVGSNGLPMSGAFVTLTGTAASQESITGTDGSWHSLTCRPGTTS